MNMMMKKPPVSLSLQQLLEDVSQRSGIALKQDIAAVSQHLPPLPAGWHPNGDDAAAIPLGASDSGAGYQLLAIEGMQGKLVTEQPWFAGWCSVMVNCSDIAAMGGRPTAVVDALWCNGDHKLLAELLRGMRDAASHLGVPIVGGHTNIRSVEANLAVSIIGHANRLLSAFAARPGQILVAAIDHRGRFQNGSLNWNAATMAPAERLRGDLELLPLIAEQQLAYACKDISQAGLLGTVIMLLESSQCGAELDLDRLPVPALASLNDWLCAFPSYGYLLTTDAERLPQLLATFAEREITAAAIGEINDSQTLTVSWQGEQRCFYNLREQSLTGFT
ncbi:sll0787 family AIR synthase-like protein [Oceanobacter mangrovi]|uniref:sll0787 family AIR synthase-like protein n=1 Tax=Oceanobacter mangrovi TaxID=2862510 RepID=UPI001C8EB3BB|nr:sll0787 family AIR synthase-like protein [Oceanobacter mangrovi]